ncbi:MAG: amidohydrolase family protein, partial [Planctomycetota bacterium]|nr:amidohydrolase family protein [Planctomycetota bacterium]
QDGATAHPGAAMLRAGIPVALGTDGRPCLPASGPAANRLSIAAEVRLLQEDGATLEQWLPMATVHGAAALGVPLEQVLIEPGVTTGLIALPLESSNPVRIRPGHDVLTLLGPGA